jgi:phospholipase/carboxylesterase
MTIPPPIEINPGGKPRFTIIWLHGLGADGNDFVPIVEQLGLPSSLALRYVFPNAPSIPVTINQGYVMPSWYDIYAVDLTARIDRQGIQRSTDYLQSLIVEEQENGVPAERIILAGFSQGGLIALTAALGCQQKLLGVMALSTYLPLEVESPGYHELEIFQAHGQMDNVVPYPVGLDTRHRLEQFGHRLAWHEYSMEHTVSIQEITDIRNWLLARLSG